MLLLMFFKDPIELPTSVHQFTELIHCKRHYYLHFDFTPVEYPPRTVNPANFFLAKINIRKTHFYVLDMTKLFSQRSNNVSKLARFGE